MPDHGSAAEPVFEFATFTVHDADEAALLAKRPAMIEALQRAFPGALAAWLVKQDDGSWLDVVLWRSRHEAEEAARTIDEIPKHGNGFGTSPSRAASATRPSPTNGSSRYAVTRRASTQALIAKSA